MTNDRFGRFMLRFDALKYVFLPNKHSDHHLNHLTFAGDSSQLPIELTQEAFSNFRHALSQSSSSCVLFTDQSRLAPAAVEVDGLATGIICCFVET